VIVVARCITKTKRIEIAAVARLRVDLHSLSGSYRRTNAVSSAPRELRLPKSRKLHLTPKASRSNACPSVQSLRQRRNHIRSAPFKPYQAMHVILPHVGTHHARLGPASIPPPCPLSPSRLEPTAEPQQSPFDLPSPPGHSLRIEAVRNFTAEGASLSALPIMKNETSRNGKSFLPAKDEAFPVLRHQGLLSAWISAAIG
jgi:hypothetical protein